MKLLFHLMFNAKWNLNCEDASLHFIILIETFWETEYLTKVWQETIKFQFDFKILFVVKIQGTKTNYSSLNWCHINTKSKPISLTTSWYTMARNLYLFGHYTTCLLNWDCLFRVCSKYKELVLYIPFVTNPGHHPDSGGPFFFPFFFAPILIYYIVYLFTKKIYKMLHLKIRRKTLYSTFYFVIL